jgi:hypothetical protein
MTTSQHHDQDSNDFGDHRIKWPLSRCPTCGSERLEPVVERVVDEVHFLCRDCARCWHVELGYVHRVAPATCLGCPHRARCVPVYVADQAGIDTDEIVLDGEIVLDEVPDHDEAAFQEERR